jgi:hypothetical protein
MSCYIPPGQQPAPPPTVQHNSFIPPGSAQPPAEPHPTKAASRGNMVPADLAHLAEQVTRLNNRNAWRAICQTLATAGIPPGPGFGIASKAVWAERKAIRRAARAAGLPWRPLGKAQLRALRRLSKAAIPVAPHPISGQACDHAC